jgi:D-amino-acid oxidase
MQTNSAKAYWSFARSDPESGVEALPMKEYFDDRDNDDEIWYKSLMPDYEIIPKQELPTGCTFGVKYTALSMNPLLLLPWLKEQLLAKGVTFIRQEIKSIDEAREITKAKVTVNASGLGAKELAGDNSVVCIRGQTMFVKTEFREMVIKTGSEYTYVMTRAGSGGVIIGGIKSERLDAEVDVELKSDILMRVNRITNGAFDGLDLESVEDIIGFRPGRTGGLRVEREGDVVHAYGFAGAGYIFSFGVAERVRALIDDLRF